MRDPDLIQRADRAAIALEQAWERWRAMHGLGAEPLPPVSSYVGYSHEEPWGQPRVVFGLRADEAELLASLLEGHDCVGSVYSEVGARLDWRLSAGAPASMPARGYSAPLGVPAQAPPPGIDLLPPGPPDGFAVGRLGAEDATSADDPGDTREQRQAAPRATRSGSAKGRTTRTTRPARSSRRATETVADRADATGQDDESIWSVDSDMSAADLPVDADAAAPDELESLDPLPDTPDLQARSDEATEESATGAPRGRGPGYRGPRYQGFPPRYDSSLSDESDSGQAAVPDEEDDDFDFAVEPPSVRRPHVGKLSRARRRNQGG